MTDVRIVLSEGGVALCGCGCGEQKGGGTFRPGHDAKLKSALALAEYQGNKIVFVANGDETKMTPLEYAATRKWDTKVAKMAEKMRRDADIAAKREASKPIGKQNRPAGTGSSLNVMKAAVAVLRAYGLHTGPNKVEVTRANAAEIAAGQHPDVPVQRHKSGLFVGQTVRSPEGGYRVAVIAAIHRGKVTMQTTMVGGGGATHIVPVDEVVVDLGAVEVPAGPSKEDAA